MPPAPPDPVGRYIGSGHLRITADGRLRPEN
jgi:hypothetical protein